jgi:flagellin-specific chaperone FliS
MQTLLEILCDLKSAIAVADIEEAEELINKALDIIG